MKPLEIRDQVRLGPRRSLQLAVSGMGFRLFRSLVNVAVLALAVAFLVHMLCYALISERAVTLARDALADHQRAQGWATRLTSPDSIADILFVLAAPHDTAQTRLAEYRSWLGGSEPAWIDLRASAARLQQFTRHIHRLPAAARAALLGSAESPLALAQRLAIGSEFEAFERKRAELHLPPPFGSEAAFRSFALHEAPAVFDAAARLRDAHARALDQFAASGAGHPADRIVADASAAAEAARAAGFHADLATFQHIASVMAAQRETVQLRDLLRQARVRDSLSQALADAALAKNPDALLVAFQERRIAERAAPLLVAPGLRDQPFDPATLQRLAQEHVERARLQRILAADDSAAVPSDRFWGLPTGTWWLLALSMLVCGVGVANAMFMSVTERFTEIATMKCLGALDTFIMMTFVFEAMLQGLIGGAIGVLLGLTLGLARAALMFGAFAWPAFAWSDQMVGSTLAWFLGVALAMVAAVGPAWTASRLAPMEAMRVD